MEKIKREKLIMKIICAALAVILWFYVSFFENPTMTKTVDNVPVSITDEQLDRLKDKGLSIYSISKEGVDVKVTARRLTLATQTNNTLTARIDISSINKPGVHFLPVKIVSDDGADASYYVEETNVKIVVEPIITGDFKIESNVDSSYVAFDKCSLSTDTVTISAPKSIYDEIGTIKTEYINLTERVDSKVKALVIYNKNGKVIDSNEIDMTPERVEVQFSYLNEKSVPIILLTASGRNIELPDEYNVTIYGNNEVLSSVESLETEVLNINQYSENSTANVDLNIPDDVKVIGSNKQIEIKLDSSFFE